MFLLGDVILPDPGCGDINLKVVRFMSDRANFLAVLAVVFLVEAVAGTEEVPDGTKTLYLSFPR